MYPGKFLSLANKGWDWAPLLKHVGIWVKKKVSYMLKKSERITRKIWRIFGASKLSMKFKDQNSEEIQKVEDTKNQTTRWWIQRNQRSNIKDEEFQISSIVVSKSCNSRLCILGLLN